MLRQSLINLLKKTSQLSSTKRNALVFGSHNNNNNNSRLLSTTTGILQNNTGGSNQSLINIDVNNQTGIATITLNRPPVNSLNVELLTELSNAFDQIESNRSKGLILTSSSKSVFSAGLDIMEMYKPNETRLKEFWTALQDVWLKLYGSSYPTAAAINGHAPAGGCLLALCCEYRVMCPNYTIGLNETRLGIVAPKWFMAAMQNVLPKRIAEQALITGTMFTTDQALKIGLIDDIAVDKNDAIEKSNVFLSQFNKISREARAITKQSLRSHDIQQLQDTRNQDVDLFVFAVTQKKVQKGLEMYLESLKMKK